MADLKERTRARLSELLRDFPSPPAALIPALYIVQEEETLDEASLTGLAAFLDMPKSQVYQTATFYSLFDFGPRGRHTIRLCRSICCFLRGGDDILTALTESLGIGPGETTPDGIFSLRMSECLAACDRAPCLQVDDSVHGPLTPDGVDAVLEKYRGK